MCRVGAVVDGGKEPGRGCQGWAEHLQASIRAQRRACIFSIADACKIDMAGNNISASLAQHIEALMARNKVL